MSTRLFEQTTNSNPDPSYRIAFGKAAVNTLNMTFTNFFAFLRVQLGASESAKGVLQLATQTEVNTGTDDTKAVTPLKLANANTGVRQKVIDIGDWNMDTTATPAGIAHGLDWTKIRGINVLIRTDAIGFPRAVPLLAQDSSPNAIFFNETVVVLTRQTGGVFDEVSYSTTFYNRGWIIIDYIP